MNRDFKKDVERSLKVWKRLPHPIRWVVVATIGVTLLVIGLVFMVLPGPGIPFIIAGLAILASEFAWAEVLLNKTKHHSKRIFEQAKSKTKRKKK